MSVTQTDASTFSISNFSVYEATVIFPNPDDSLKFVYNATRSPAKVSLANKYQDVSGRIYSTGTITLAPYSSAVLLRLPATK